MNQEERNILDECIHVNKCERLLCQYWEIVRFTVIRAFQVRHVHFTQDDIEELRNDVFVRLFENDRKKLKQYDESFGLTLRSWIKLIASQTVGMYLRKKDRIGYLGVTPLIPIEDLDEALGSIDETPRYDARQVLMMLEEMMKGMSHTERLVLQLHFEQGLSWQDVASALHRNINNIYQIRHRALKHLKEIIKCL
jgi:RNA polymerase sigma factor (sigma-70 family)